MYALITGASSGIGKEIARILAYKGYDLILIARREDRLIRLKQILENRYHINVEYGVHDLSKRSHIYSLYDTYKSYDIEILVNGAGFGKVGNFSEVPLDSELDMIETNIIALHMLTKLFLKTMTHGHILNIASIAGFQPGPYLATYSATKSYVANLSLAINYELKRLGRPIHISALCPGPVKTEFDTIAGTRFSLRSITARDCAKCAVSGMFQNKQLIIPSLTSKAAYWGSKLSPLKTVLPIEYHIQTSKLKG